MAGHQEEVSELQIFDETNKINMLEFRIHAIRKVKIFCKGFHVF